MAEQCTNPDYQSLLQPGTRHSIRISEMMIGMAAQRIGTIEVEMRKATIITDKMCIRDSWISILGIHLVGIEPFTVTIEETAGKKQPLEHCWVHTLLSSIP